MLARSLLRASPHLSPTSPSTLLRYDTIFAPATSRGKSAIAILRISGPQVLKVWYQMTAPPVTAVASSSAGNTMERAPTMQIGTSKDALQSKRESNQLKSLDRPPIARRAHLRRIIDPINGATLDEGIVLYFPASASLTAQPTLELHTHGSPALMNLLIDRLPTLSSEFRIAEPGEFTRLAFEAGKLDLTQVEGIRDLIESDTETQRKLAARQAGGQMSKSYNAMRSSIIESSALIEALIDFGEDEGIPVEVFERAQRQIITLQELVRKQLDDGRRGEIIRNGIRLAIVGAPNAGKSSLLNWLAQRDAAIVTSTPGTTRDIIELSFDFHGFPIILADTAGLRMTTNEVEQIGVERAQIKAKSVDIKICVISIGDLSSPTSAHVIDPLTLSLIDHNTMIVLNKIDALTSEQVESRREAVLESLRSVGIREWIGNQVWEISLRDEKGLREFVEGMKHVLKLRYDLSDDLEDTPIVTTARHRRHLEECLSSLNAFLQTSPDEIVIAAEELRYALLSLGRITGAVDVEEVLGEIFSGFCIGK